MLVTFAILHLSFKGSYGQCSVLTMYLVLSAVCVGSAMTKQGCYELN